MRIILVALSMIGLAASHAGADEIVKLKATDLAIVAGNEWSGTLTYLNYQEPFIDFSIPAEIEVTTTDTGLDLFFKYPDEPHMNSGNTFNVSADGTMLDDKTIVSMIKNENSVREIRTVGACEDMGKPASCEMVYTLSETMFSFKKMVTYEGETEAFRRNEFIFTREAD